MKMEDVGVFILWGLVVIAGVLLIAGVIKSFFL